MTYAITNVHPDIEKEFSEIREHGYEITFSVNDPVAAGEWGIRIIVLDDSTVAYRTENPMIDGDWQVGKIEDASESLADVEADWQEFRNSE